MVRLSGPDARANRAGTHGSHARAGATARDVREARRPAQSPAARWTRSILTNFRGPRSYTGEDVVEITAHGNPWLLSQWWSATTRGARVAEPGEFTFRAYLNGRIDLVRAEAVADLDRGRDTGTGPRGQRPAERHAHQGHRRASSARCSTCWPSWRRRSTFPTRATTSSRDTMRWALFWRRLGARRGAGRFVAGGTRAARGPHAGARRAPQRRKVEPVQRAGWRRPRHRERRARNDAGPRDRAVRRDGDSSRPRRHRRLAPRRGARWRPRACAAPKAPPAPPT